MQKLLIIDDEAPIRRLLRINLEDRYQIVDTGDPELALAAALQSKPNAILLDLRMPNYSGFELCRTFKSITSTQLIPIIIVTGKPAPTPNYTARNSAPRRTSRNRSTLRPCETAWRRFCKPLSPSGEVKCAFACESR